MNSKLPVLGYIASPYNHRCENTRLLRKKLVINLAAELIQKGYPVVSPIAHNVTIINETNAQSGWQHWQQLDTVLLYGRDYLLVYKLDGWKASVGMSSEIFFSEQNDIPIVYFDENGSIEQLLIEIRQIKKRIRLPVGG